MAATYYSNVYLSTESLKKEEVESISDFGIKLSIYSGFERLSVTIDTTVLFDSVIMLGFYMDEEKADRFKEFLYGQQKVLCVLETEDGDIELHVGKITVNDFYCYIGEKAIPEENMVGKYFDLYDKDE